MGDGVETIGRVLKVRPGEGRVVLPVVGLSFAASAGHAIGQSGASALFLDRIGTQSLPLMYLLQGGSAIALMLVVTSILGRVDRRRAYVAAPAGLAGVVLAERAALLTGGRWIYSVLWLTAGLALLVQTVAVWGIAGVVTDTRRAKRLFPLFAGGGILGSVAGGLVTAPLVQIVGAEDLLVVWMGSLVVMVPLARAALPSSQVARDTRRRSTRRARPSALGDLVAALRYVSRSRLLAWMTLAAVLFSVLFYSLFLPWATAAADRYRNADDLAAFLGMFWAAMTGMACMVSVLAANRLIGRFGLVTMVLVLPLVYAGSFGILVASSTFATLVLVRFVAGVWLQGVASPAWETLTNVVPEGRRDQVRAFLNGGPSQVGTAIAGAIALVGQEVLSFRQFATIGLGAAALTAFVVWRVRKAYASALVEALRVGRPQVFPEAPVAGIPFALDRDANALRSVLEATGDDSPSVRRLAVQLLADIEDDRARASIERALHDEDPTVRAEAVVRHGRRSEEAGRVEELLPLIADPDPVVVASASAVLLGRTRDPVVAERLRSLLHHEDPSVRASTVQRLERAHPTAALPFVREALEDEAPGVRAAALLALSTLQPERALDSTTRLLEDASARVRDAAVEASARIGDRSVEPLLSALTRPGARDDALRALARLNLGTREAAVRAFVQAWVADASRDEGLRAAVEVGGEAADLLRDALLDRARRNGRIALRALSLVSDDGPAMRAAIDNLDARDGSQVAIALETLEATGDMTIVRQLIPLWEPGASRDVHADVSGDWLERILQHEDRFIRSCGELVSLARNGGEEMARAPAMMTVMERVLFLRKVPLFEPLAPADLVAIAEVAEEETYADGELLAAQGETGEELHIVVSGTVRVESQGMEIARRRQGDVVGELSLITRGPRMASLVADGDVRAIRIRQRAFESMVLDRPDIAIGVMRVLAQRLVEQRPLESAH